MNPLLIALFRGRGLISALIRWQTRGRYSHAAIIQHGRVIIEAWAGKGVRKTRLTDWRDVDVYEVPMSHAQRQAALAYAETRIGNRAAILPAIEGRAWITGYHKYVVSPSDPWPSGYVLNDTWGVSGQVAQ